MAVGRSRSWCWSLVLMFRPTGLLGERVGKGAGGQRSRIESQFEDVEDATGGAPRRAARAGSGGSAQRSGTRGVPHGIRDRARLPPQARVAPSPAPWSWSSRSCRDPSPSAHHDDSEYWTPAWSRSGSRRSWPGLERRGRLRRPARLGLRGVLRRGRLHLRRSPGRPGTASPSRPRPNAEAFKPHWHMYFWLFFFAAMAVALLAGVILGAPDPSAPRRLSGHRTLGFGEIIRITANNLTARGGPTRRA